jgi:CO/xanthine dehydrogenase FAD-binding subunit
VDDAVAARFGELCSAAARPIDDVRGSAVYRRHAVGVMARRAVSWAMAELAEAAA